MVVVISNDVQSALDEYKVSLGNYPIPKERAYEKYDKMVDALNGLGASLIVPPVCVHKDLGQQLDAEGKPIFKNLRRFNYSDESGFQWAFACYYSEEDDTITITKMIAASFVTETIETVILPILEFNQRLSAIR